MNPVDHPHGGGEGKTSGGRHPVSPTGVPAKGYKTRKNKRSDKWIVQKRKYVKFDVSNLNREVVCCATVIKERSFCRSSLVN